MKLASVRLELMIADALAWLVRSCAVWFTMAALGGSALAVDKVGDLGKPEVRGLRSTVGSVAHPDDTLITIQYILQWTDPHNAWVLDQEEPVNVSFWNMKAQPPSVILVEIKLIKLERGFLAGSTTSMSASITAHVPPGATAVSLALGTSGLETERVQLPGR
jgi:hypothetical protein